MDDNARSVTATYSDNARRRRGSQILGTIVVPFTLAAYATWNLAPPQLLAGPLSRYLVVITLVLAPLALVHLIRAPEAGSAWVLIFAMTLMPAVAIGTDSDYGRLKLLGIALALTVTIAAVQLVNAQQIFHRFIQFYVGFAAIATTYTLLTAIDVSNGRLASVGQAPISAGRLAGVTVLGCVVYLFWSKTKSGPKIAVSILLAAVSVLVLVQSGSRGPLAGAAFAAAILLIPSKSSPRFTILRFGTLACTSILAYEAFTASPTDQVAYGRVFTTSTSGRSYIYSETVSVLAEHPLGIGWGNLSDYVSFESLEPGRLYAHNLFLEVASEGGLLALFGLVIILIVAFRRIRNSSVSEPIWHNLFISQMVFAFVNAMFSSDFAGNRSLWVFVGIALSGMYSPSHRAVTARLVHSRPTWQESRH